MIQANKISLIVENHITHKEKIDGNILELIKYKTHYNSKNINYPEPIGRGNFLLDNASENFIKSLNNLKRAYDITDIPPKKYFEIKKGIKNILEQINKYESENKESLLELAENIIRKTFNVPNNIEFSIDGELIDEFDGDNVLRKYENTFEDYTFDEYNELESSNKHIDRCRLNYSLVCGGANNCMWLYKKYEDELDSIDYRLHKLYDKFLSFNDFNIWVTPDEILSTEIGDMGGYEIFDNGNGYIISIDAPNFLSMLYEMSKAILSILFQEKYNNPYVDYEDIWNTRIGNILWRKFIKCANVNPKFSYVVDSINQLTDEDYTYIMKEVLSETNHSKNMFKELYNSIK